MQKGATVLVTVLVVMCVGRISTDILNQSIDKTSTVVVYTCPENMSLCPQAYAICSCTIRSSRVKYKQWYLSLPLCKGKTIKLLHNGTNCSSQYQQCGSIRAWNELQSDPSKGTEKCNTTTLLINADPTLNGLMFECQNSKRTTLNIIAPPDAPNITAVYRLSPTQLTVVWSPASTGSFPTSFHVNISAEGANAPFMSTAIVGADKRTPEYSYTFTNLTSSTTYTVSIVAINCAGNSSSVHYTGVTALECQDETIYSDGIMAVYGRNNLIVITPPDAPYITAVYRLSPTQLTVVWSPASSGGPSTSFSVSIGAEGVNASLMSIVGADRKSQEYSYTFTRLARGTTYTVCVVAINCAGNSSSVYHTGVTVSPDAPNITAVYSLSPTQLTVVWSPASTGSFPTSFSVSISESANASLMNTAIVGADERSHTLTNLTSSTTYTVSVVAINYAGNSDPVCYTGVTDSVCPTSPSILQKDDIIEITTSIGGAALVLLMIVSILCIWKYIGRCKKCGGYVSIPPEPSPTDSRSPPFTGTSPHGQEPTKPDNPPALDVQPEQPPPQTSPAPRPGPPEISSLAQTPPQELPAQSRKPLGPPSLPLLMSFPARGGNINIVQRIGTNYFKFGIFLLNDDNGDIMERLKHDNQPNAENTTTAIFRTWLQGGGREWSHLVAALRNVNLITLADLVEVVTKEH